MFCPNCGTQLPDVAKFCLNCGCTMASKQVPPEVPSQPSLDPRLGEDDRTGSSPMAPKKPIKAKKKSPLPVIIIALVLVLVAAAAAAVWFFLLQPESVYLLEKYEYTSGNYSYEQVWEYDENGRLLSYDESGGSVGRTTRSTVTYEYEDGRVVSAVFAFHNPNGVEIGHVYDGLELEYVYDGDVLVEITGENSLGDEFEATCDDEGRINELVATYSDGSEWYSVSYTYDDDGNLEEEVISNVPHQSKEVRTYEDGNLVESVVYSFGKLSSHAIHDYDKNGNLVEYKYWSYDENNVILHAIEYAYEYNDDGKILSFNYSSESYDGTTSECSFVAEWEDDTFAKVTYTGDYSCSYEEWEYDEHGNHICTRSYDADGELVAEATWSYVEVKIPRGSKSFNESDPIWFLWLMNNY